MSDSLTPRERVFRASDDDVELSRELDNYRISLIQAITDSFSKNLDKAKLVAKLQEMDKQTKRADAEGSAEGIWFYFRDSIEDVLEVPRGTLDTGN